MNDSVARTKQDIGTNHQSAVFIAFFSFSPIKEFFKHKYTTGEHPSVSVRIVEKTANAFSSYFDFFVKV